MKVIRELLDAGHGVPLFWEPQEGDLQNDRFVITVKASNY